MQRGFFNMDFIEELFANHRSKRLDTSLQIWTIYNLTAWYKYWIADTEARVAA